MRRPHRRHFLGTAGLASVGLAFSPLRSRGGPGPNETVVVGVMGLSRGLDLTRTFSKQPGVIVKYVCDVDSQRIGRGIEAATSHGQSAPTPLSDFRKILDDPEVDALICAAPNHWHAPATILACAAGKHVYVEKPCSHNPREGELMVEAARKQGRCVQMGTQRRSSKATQEAIAAIREGEIGRVYLARAWYANQRDSIGKGRQTAVPSNLDFELWQGPAPRIPYVDNLVHYNWHWRWNWGNGELGNNGVHSLDLCRWGLGVDFPQRVTSSGGRYRYEDDQETPDTHTVCFDFPNRASITWHGLSCNGREEGFVTFYGEKGSLALQSNGAHTFFDLANKPIRSVPGDTVGDAEHAANFLSCVRSSDASLLNQEITSGHKSTLLCHLGNIAHRVGRLLNCDPATGKILNDPEAMTHWTRVYEPGWEPKVV